MTKATLPGAEAPAAALTLNDLQAALRATDRAALLVPSRILRRVIKQHAGVPGLGLRVPHRKTYLIGRDELLRIVTLGELGLRQVDELAEAVILIVQPHAERLESRPAADSLTVCWRLLFHGRIHLALERAAAAGRLTPAVVRRRIEAIGATEFEEIRAVLKQEDFLLPAADDVAVYVEFAALFLELKYFVHGFLGCYFPAIEHLGRVEELLREEVDAEAVFQATRLPGAPEVPRQPDASAPEADLDLPPSSAAVPSRSALRRGLLAERLLARAERARAVGNLVRAAILRTRGSRQLPSDQARRARSKARDDLERLALRLHAALGFQEAEIEDWLRGLVGLAAPASGGVWSREARILYDLQKACVDHERGVYGLNLWAWLWSRGAEPLKRPLPGHRDVQICKHLRSAAGRLSDARLDGRLRTQFLALVEAAVDRAEEALRRRYRPQIHAAFDEVGLAPANLPERVARDKLVEELLDDVVERGFFLMGDLRDALSRNQLKLPDVGGLGPLLRGDQLLKANDLLAATLGGVYRGGEVYLTFPQRLSSLAFGTRVGRFLTRYAALPFGGAFLLLEFVQHLLHMLPRDAALHHFQPRWWGSVLALGLLLEGVLHSPAFRTALASRLAWIGRGLRRALVEWPRRLAELPAVRALLDSRWFALARRYLFKPLTLTVALTALAAIGWGAQAARQASLPIFLAANVLVNSRFGRNVDELVTDWVVHAWHRLRIRVLAAVLRLVADLFHRVLEGIERLLYTVDEWLRFRAGEGRRATVVKTVLGSLWFFVNYVIRFCVNLLIEPQINPIKHFPVVTVSHKILLPMQPLFAALLMNAFDKAWAELIAVVIVTSLPGVFGFLVWELKENWRLYAANRARQLRPVRVGHHGETVVQFMRPGFRSGTLPKLFARLRRANRKAYWSGNWRSASRQLAGLRGVEQALRRLVDRELLRLLELSNGWTADTLSAGELHLGSNRLLVELYCPEFDADSLWLVFEVRADALLAGVHRRGWLDRLEVRAWRTLDNALAGFYALAGVDLVREQLDAELGKRVQHYRIVDDGLEVMAGREAPLPLFYPLAADPPRPLDASLADAALVADAPEPEELIFARTPITWSHWVVVWDLDQLDASGRQRIIEGRWVLPAATGEPPA